MTAMAGPFISAVSDELAANIEAALQLAAELNLDGIALRISNERRFPDWSAEDLEALRRSSIPLTYASPGLWKEAVSPDQEEGFAAEVRRMFAAARSVGAGAVSFFSGMKSGEEGRADPRSPNSTMPELVVERLRCAAGEAGQSGMLCLLENGWQTWGDTGASAAEIVRRVDHPALRLIWDPANSLAALHHWAKARKAAVPEGNSWLLDEFERIRDLLVDVHVRDLMWVQERVQWEPAGDGMIDWPGLICQLRRADSLRSLTIEHHQFHRRTEAARLTAARLRAALVPQ